MRQYSIFILAAMLMFVTSCSKEKSSKIVAEKFLKAYSCGEYDEAKQYATEQTRRMVHLSSVLAKTAPAKPAPKEYEILECREIGNKATVKYRVKGSSGSETMFLVKRNEDWLVGLE